MNLLLENKERIALAFVRFAIAFSFLSALADRFGFWGEFGTSGVYWGNHEKFEQYVALLNPYLHEGLIPSLAYIVSGMELALAVCLIFGWFLKEASFISFLLLLSFAIAMTFALGVKPPFDYSVLTASAASLLLYVFVSKDNKKS